MANCSLDFTTSSDFSASEFSILKEYSLYNVKYLPVLSGDCNNTAKWHDQYWGG